jgi:hypothetical protein
LSDAKALFVSVRDIEAACVHHTKLLRIVARLQQSTSISIDADCIRAIAIIAGICSAGAQTHFSNIFDGETYNKLKPIN